MHRVFPQFLVGVACSAAALSAQVPAPNPQARVAPRAEWITTGGVSGAVPANRHWSQSASNDTSLFVFGGRTGTAGSGSKRNDLHEFDGSTLAWTEHNPDGAPGAPSQRFRNGLAWDASGSRLVMFGGEDGAGGLLSDTWTWTVASGWVSIPATGPSARRFASMAYDPTTTGILMFGGDDGSGTALGDTWLFIGTTWVPVSALPSPGARANHTLVTRNDFGDVFLCAGNDLSTSGRVHYLDAWVWTGANWNLVTPTTTAVPHGHAGNQAVYDPIRQRVVLQGGQGISTNAGATGGAYGASYGGSPSSWTSEFDCVTNEWLLYGASTSSIADPVIGRASRYYPGFIPAAGKVYMWGGQNPSGTGVPLTTMKEYQANPVATADPVGSGCTGIALAGNGRPWLGRNYDMVTTGLTPGSLMFLAVGFTSAPVPLMNLHPAGVAGCDLLLMPATTVFLPVAGTSVPYSFAMPSAPSFAGGILSFQSIQVEVSGAMVTAIKSSNALTLAVGAL